MTPLDWVVVAISSLAALALAVAAVAARAARTPRVVCPICHQRFAPGWCDNHATPTDQGRFDHV